MWTNQTRHLLVNGRTLQPAGAVRKVLSTTCSGRFSKEVMHKARLTVPPDL